MLYLAAMALILTLDGRGYAEMGTKGMTAVEVVRTTDDQQVTVADQADFDREMAKGLARTNAALEHAFEALNRQEQRLERLEDKG